MKRPVMIGVMGGGRAEERTHQRAYRLGELVAENGWYLLNGGRDAGIMAASAAGAAARGGLVVGILPGENRADMAAGVTIPIVTGLGSARNSITALSSDVVVACPGGAGTLSEIALALKAGTPVITMGFSLRLSTGIALDADRLFSATEPEGVIRLIKEILFSAG
ncbi:MAG: TIGR00725 family protein [Desulfosudaceae bacterium]